MTHTHAPSPVLLALIVYVPMMLSGYWAAAPGVLRGTPMETLLPGMLAATLAGWAILRFSRWATARTGWGQAMAREFRQVLGGLGSGQILALALLSAVGEEVLFRGVLHPRLGLVPTALLFALLHFPYRRAMLPWTLFALAFGLLAGALTNWAGSLWPAIWAHFLVNYFNLHHLAEAPQDTQGEDDVADL